MKSILCLKYLELPVRGAERDLSKEIVRTCLRLIWAGTQETRRSRKESLSAEDWSFWVILAKKCEARRENLEGSCLSL